MNEALQKGERSEERGLLAASTAGRDLRVVDDRRGVALDAAEPPRLVDLSRVPITIEVDPARLRPSDNPVIAGDRSRITSETGWVPAIPIEQTLSDLLDYWRAAIVQAS